VIGVLICGDSIVCFTLEPLYDGRPKIPPGNYICTRGRYNKGGYETYEIPVPGHTQIKFHKGNYLHETDGCILVGSIHEEIDSRALFGSAAAMKRFMTLAGDAKEILLVVE
jgi:hypothetical protein